MSTTTPRARRAGRPFRPRGSSEHEATETTQARFFITGPNTSVDELDALVRERVEDVVDNAGWTAIDQAERAAGKEATRSRVKLVTVKELLVASAGRR